MPVQYLTFAANLENIAELQIDAHNHWRVNVASESGEVREGVTFSIDEEQEVDGSPGVFHLVVRFPGERKASTLKIITDRTVKNVYTAADSGKPVRVLAVECRGLEVTAWSASTDFSAFIAADSNYKFENPELVDGEWAEYDEEGDQSVMVTEVVTAVSK